MAQIGSIEIDTASNGWVEVPIFETSDLDGPIIEVQTQNNGWGGLNVVDPSNAELDFLEVYTQSNGWMSISKKAFWIYTGNRWDIVTNVERPFSIEHDSSGNYLVVDRYYDTVEEFDSTWSHLSSHDVSTASTDPTGVHQDGTSYYISATGTDGVYRFDDTWTYQEKVAGEQDLYTRDVHRDADGAWWVLGNDSTTVYAYDSTFSKKYRTNDIDVSSETSDPSGIYQDSSGNWWLFAEASCMVLKYDSAWNYTGVSYDISGTTTELQDAIKDGDYWYTVQSDHDNETVFEFQGY